MKQRIVPVIAAMLLLCTMPVYASQPPEADSGGDTTPSSIYYIQAESEAQPEQPHAPVSIDEARSTPDQAREIYPVSVQITEQNGILFLHRVYEVAPDFDPENLAQPFEQDGFIFSRQDVLKQELPGTTETRLAYKMESYDTDETDESKIKQQIVPVIDHEENGYTGQLQLDSSSVVIEASGYSYYQYTVTKEKEFNPLDRNDPVYMEKDTDQNGVSMKLMDVEWSAQATAHVAGSPVPTAYSGNAIYQGVATGRTATGYTVTAAYIGELTKVTPGNMRYTIIFRGEPLEQEKEPINPVPIAAASTVTGGGIFYVVFFFYLKRNAKIYNLQNGQYVLVDKQRIKAANPAIDLSGMKHKTIGGGFLISLDKSIAAKLHGTEIHISSGVRQLQHMVDNPGGGAYQFEICL